MKRFFTDLMNYFTSITTGIVFVFIVILYCVGDTGMYLTTLAEIPLMGILTALVTAVIHHDEVSGRRLAVRIGIHFVLISIIVSVFGVLFGWVDADFRGISMMVLGTAGVYVFTAAVTFFTAKKEADELNQALQKKRAR